MKVMKKINNWITRLLDYIKIIFKFSINDLKKRYSGSIGGFLWAYIQPLVSILVFWFVFEVGFKNPPVQDMPFILWLVPSYIAWSYTNDAISQSSNVLYEYNYLVKKIKFKIEILPIIKVVVALIVHTFFICLCYGLYLGYGFSFNWTWIQIFYYMFALTFLLIGISWIVSSLSVFWKDIAQIVNVLLQIGFWMAPVFWNPETINEGILRFFKLNPFFYIIQGYRDCFVGNIFFYEHYLQTIYFWGFTAVIFVVGLFIFRKLSKHYADLL